MVLFKYHFLPLLLLLLFLEASLLVCLAFNYQSITTRTENSNRKQYRHCKENLSSLSLSFAVKSSTTGSDDTNNGNKTKINQLKQSLIELSQSTKRGFFASSSQQAEAKDIIQNLALLNPTKEPVAAYYDDNEKGGFNNNGKMEDSITIAGRWTLLYTNAPDITSLDPNTSLFPIKLPSTAKLGRIGQECDAVQSTISNVIEWRRPDWISNIMVQTNQNSDNDRILQKVVCEAKASKKEPTTVQLKLVGLELLGDTNGIDKYKNDDYDNQRSTILSSILKGPVELLKRNPIQLRGPLKTPFGRFEVLFLDEQMRIIKTGQGYYAVNIREDPWF